MIFPSVQVAFRADVDESTVGATATFSLLIRTPGQTLVTSVYGVIHAQTIASDISADHDGITLLAMNNLGTLDVSSVSQFVLMRMEAVACHGLHIISVVALILVAIGTMVNRFSWQKG